MLKLIWNRFLRPRIIEWLDARALRLPQAVKHQLARKLQVSEAVIEAVETLIRERVIDALTSWEP